MHLNVSTRGSISGFVGRLHVNAASGLPARRKITQRNILTHSHTHRTCLMCVQRLHPWLQAEGTSPRVVHLSHKIHVGAVVTAYRHLHADCRTFDFQTLVVLLRYQTGSSGAATRVGSKFKSSWAVSRAGKRVGWIISLQLCSLEEELLLLGFDQSCDSGKCGSGGCLRWRQQQVKMPV